MAKSARSCHSSSNLPRHLTALASPQTSSSLLLHHAKPRRPRPSSFRIIATSAHLRSSTLITLKRSSAGSSDTVRTIGTSLSGMVSLLASSSPTTRS
ncbi:hypothetical protein BOTBODRAFT_493066 [Botryobasidium botryosum FD-172 SS1]|uniref:Uncharacterized protein n=1 Tax=Botryobasidium botryosum (strain FD-172 SS1) TaxID=930990 RepID=A0A067M4M4_BOTB1|nr:hypothetical protein BOTBODRAFT_493066 [Botryobasidium botryosum FD-172 SS1]